MSTGINSTSDAHKEKNIQITEAAFSTLSILPSTAFHLLIRLFWTIHLRLFSAPLSDCCLSWTTQRGPSMSSGWDIRPNWSSVSNCATLSTTTERWAGACKLRWNLQRDRFLFFFLLENWLCCFCCRWGLCWIRCLRNLRPSLRWESARPTLTISSVSSPPMRRESV